MRDDKVYLQHILDAAGRIESYIGDTAYDTFISKDMMIAAVVRELEIIGEAANHLSRSFCETHSDIQWQKIIAMRNYLIHEYFGVNTEIVWSTCKNNLPHLKAVVLAALKE
ncbi:MAG: DUF86 domain-containing protein [Sedimentisphaerales bacterium]|nr:DUF86 domain-containing protein [Sedimentisphaerales bacterium]